MNKTFLTHRYVKLKLLEPTEDGYAYVDIPNSKLMKERIYIDKK